MEEIKMIVMIICFASAVLLIGLGIPMALRKVKRNGVYGARMKYTMMDDDIWMEVNAMAGKGIIIIGILEAAMGAASVYFLKNIADKPTIIYFLIGVAAVEMIGLVIVTVMAVRMSRRMAADKGLIK
ncbi:MAG: hypothetical protein HPY53_14970 [Brevinematales bacterium]|nr:hypothetical protein [Brevinematales bacterium]